jgi:uncharacterized protein (DUF427 family)
MEPLDGEVVVRAGDLELARSRCAVRILETASPPTVYLPPSDVRTDWLEPGRGRSLCEWKGAASYWSLAAGPDRINEVGWSYPNPSQAYGGLRGFISFYPARVECRIDGELVRPQGGGFYGGWVTDRIAGPWKGDPGTGGW